MQIGLSHVSFMYPEKTVLEDFSMALPKTGVVCLVGPSGCGKTTLLRLLAGLEHPQQGKVRCPGRVAVVFQEDRLLPWATARQNVAAVLHAPRREALREADAWLTRAGLAGSEGLQPEALSGGMRQRVSLCRALAFRPDVLLLDEPFHALDEKTREACVTMLQQGSQKLTLLVTHAQEEAHKLADVIYLLSGPPLRVEGRRTGLGGLRTIP